MSVTVINEPAKEPVTVKEAKDFARIDYNIDDGIVDLLIRSARKQIEAFTGVGLGLQIVKYRVTVEAYVADYLLPLRDFIEASAVTYQSCRLSPVKDVFTASINWQIGGSLFSGEKGVYTITYKTGLREIPSDLKLAVLNEVAYQYENRGAEAATLSPQAKKLIQPYKLNVWGI